MLRRLTAILLVVIMLVLAGCVHASPVKQETVIAASFYPVYIFTLNLTDGIDGVEVMCMAEQNVGCLHDYTLTARDAKIAADADVFVINGAGMELFIEDIYEASEGIRIIDSSEGTELICNDSHDDEHNHGENDHGEHDHGEHDGHSHEYNSHIWMSVQNARIQVENIKDGLIEELPHCREQIESNYNAYIEVLDELSAEVKSAGEQIGDAPVMVFHDAYAYLGRDMGLNIAGTVESEDGAEPSARELARLSDEITQCNVRALFIEPDYTGSAADILSAETGVEVYTLNPVIRGEAVKTAYEDIMRENIKIITGAVK